MGGPQAEYTPVSTSDDIELSDSPEKGHSHPEGAFHDDPEATSETAYSDTPYLEDEYTTAHNGSIRSRIVEKYSQIHYYVRDSTTEFFAFLISPGWMNFFLSILIALLSSFFIPTKVDPSKPPKKVHKTSWLDGLRGIASVMVMLGHSTYLWFPGVLAGYGSCPECYYFVQLPIIRIFSSGTACVATFFVISGFSISYKSLGQMRQGNYEGVLSSLGSSTFRRAIRLLLPPVVLTFPMMLLTYYGYYATGPGSRQPPHFGTFAESFNHWSSSILWITDMWRPVFVFGTSYAVYVPPYDVSLWTIDVELYCSMVVFATLLGVSRLRPLYRLFVLIGLALWLNYLTHAYLFLFTSGVVLAELHYIREERQERNNSSLKLHCLETRKSFFQRSKPYLWILFWLLNFFLALFVITMLMVSHGAGNSPGYKTLVDWIPTRYRYHYVEDLFWIYLAAVHLVWTIDNAPFLQALFTTRFSQYCGKIGFALYLVHGTMLWTMGLNLSNRILVWNGAETLGKYTLGIFVTCVCVYPVLLWVTDLVWRFVGCTVHNDQGIE